ncbi:hypothetical protein H6S82_18235 [Planktothrix sp. FACHB-1355]|uniref:Uncharacterized protein n=1 Tax=Aerosakkonema funiforme FACHB-1375 TaxID=2949571 RepID=A0A926VLH9_9CYAN|nr:MULTISPECIES: hypothetical protein [Oscillatoriales]MBD2184649.1 hypothetical protein [Aerosakkonema funiforme FACHB-1375]MBD3560771.1 hypothetical protein [Planktothrix sp. FACHB-1355]
MAIAPPVPKERFAFVSGKLTEYITYALPSNGRRFSTLLAIAIFLIAIAIIGKVVTGWTGFGQPSS